MAEWWRVRHKKELEEIFYKQLWDVEDGIYAVAEDERDPSIPPPDPIHPYLKIWLNCRRYGNGFGAPCLPGPGSYLEQDAELMLAFDILEDVYQEIEKARKLRQEGQEALKKQIDNAATLPPFPSLSTPSTLPS